MLCRPSCQLHDAVGLDMEDLVVKPPTAAADPSPAAVAAAAAALSATPKPNGAPRTMVVSDE